MAANKAAAVALVASFLVALFLPKGLLTPSPLVVVVQVVRQAVAALLELIVAHSL